MATLSTALVFAPVGRQRLTVGSAPVGLTIPADADYAILTVESQPLRWVLSGTPVGGSAGHLAAAGTVVNLAGKPALQGFRAVRDTASDAVLEITYGKLHP